MDDKLKNAIEEYITQRMDDLGGNAPEAVALAISQLKDHMDRFGVALAGEHLVLFLEMEDAMSIQTGEETRYYYRAGFHDAVRFLMDWSDVT